MGNKKELTEAISKYYGAVRTDTQSACRYKAYPFCDHGQALLTLTTLSDDLRYPPNGDVGFMRSVTCYDYRDICEVVPVGKDLDWLLIEEVRLTDRNRGHLPIDLTKEDIRELGRVVIPLNLGWIGVIGDTVVELVDGAIGGKIGEEDVRVITANLTELMKVYENTDRSEQLAKNALWGIPFKIMDGKS